MIFTEKDIISVYLPLKLDTPYAYKVPINMTLQKGDIVVVPLRKQEITGIVFDKIDSLNFSEDKLKEVIRKDENLPPLQQELIDFLRWLCKYNMTSFGRVLKMAINVAGFDFDSYEEMLYLNHNKIKSIKVTKKRESVINCLHKEEPIEKNNLISKSGVSRQIINTLIKESVLRVESSFKSSNVQENLHYKPLVLSEEQKQLACEMKTALLDKGFQVGVLQGLPGSGKTEVYFEVMNEVLKKGQQVLILLPEIGLSTQIVDRFQNRFCVEPYVWHSDITKKSKKDTWIAASNSNLKVIIGARSSLFLPFANLGLIIVDEEHDSSYKQEEGVIYNARDMSIIRAKIHQVPIILSSATPSLETMNNIMKKKYQQFLLQSRYNQRSMPDIEVIDMNKQILKTEQYLSEPFINRIKECLEKKQQSLIFVNKRGYASCLFCKSCQEKETCINCSVSMVEHRAKNKLVCHFCGYNKSITNICSACNEKDSLISIGIGVERIFYEVKNIFPNKRITVISSDTINSHKKAIEIVKQINNYEYDILIGTQIISKGYNFPLLTFVGIVDGDFSYALDLKSSEKAWQVLYQVAGRSGRDKLEGSVMLQTYDTKSSIVESLIEKDYDMFIKKESALRESLEFPPYGKLIAVIISSKNQIQLEDFCQNLYYKIPNNIDIEILGPTNAPIYYLRGFYRKRFLIKSKLTTNIQKKTQRWILDVSTPKDIKLQIDVDPISFY